MELKLLGVTRWNQGLLGMRSYGMTRGRWGRGDQAPELSPCPQMNFIAAAFHDGVMLYAQAVNETLERGGSVTDASAITRQMWNRTFYGEPCPQPRPQPHPCRRRVLPAPPGVGSPGAPPAPQPPSPGVTGFLRIDESGDRESDYSLWDMDPVQGDFQVSPDAGAAGPTGWPGAPSHPFLAPPQDRGQLQRHHQEDPDGAGA